MTGGGNLHTVRGDGVRQIYWAMISRLYNFPSQVDCAGDLFGGPLRFLGGIRGEFSKAVIGFQNFGYDF